MAVENASGMRWLWTENQRGDLELAPDARRDVLCRTPDIRGPVIYGNLLFVYSSRQSAVLFLVILSCQSIIVFDPLSTE
jgi:hypothetical protein